MARLARTFEALVFVWDGTAVPYRRVSARAVRRRVEALCARSVDVAVVSGATVDTIDTQLGARPAGPGRLFFALGRGSELYAVDGRGPHLIWRRDATAVEEAALERAAALVVERVVLPPEAEADLPVDEGAALAMLADHPLRQDVRLAVATLRDGTRSAAMRFRLHDDPVQVLVGPDLVPGLADALAATLED